MQILIKRKKFKPAQSSLKEAYRSNVPEKTLSFFIQYKDSGIIPVAEHISMINYLSNKPVVMLYDKKTISFHELKEAM